MNFRLYYHSFTSTINFRLNDGYFCCASDSRKTARNLVQVPAWRKAEFGLIYLSFMLFYYTFMEQNAKYLRSSQKIHF